MTGFPYSANDKLPAAEYNEVAKAAGIYAADSGSSNAYVIIVSPVPSSLIAGMTFKLKAGFANTGAATLNVNGLGAKTIKKNYNQDLGAGDIVAGQLVSVEYDGTNFQMLSPVSGGMSYKNGITTFDMSSSGGQTIAHGLGKVPSKIRISAKLVNGGASLVADSIGVYNGTTVSCVYSWYVYNDNNKTAGDDSSNIIMLYTGQSSRQAVTVTVDATNINLTWNKSGGPSGTAQIMWEAE